MPNARLLIYPGVHGDFIGELCVCGYDGGVFG